MAVTDPIHDARERADVVTIGSRNSKLALVQTRDVITKLHSVYGPRPDYQVLTGGVTGDADKRTPFKALAAQTGLANVGKSLWTTSLEADLVDGKYDFLIHCLKDMPTTLPLNCALSAITEREDPSDAVVMSPRASYTRLCDLPAGSVVGTSSCRRKALIGRSWPHLVVQECRGNIDTRLAKLDHLESPFTCIILATAGLNRMHLQHRITERLHPADFPYAVGQGALGIEISTHEPDVAKLVMAVDHRESRWCGLAERAMLRSLRGGCSSPIGVWCRPEATPDGASDLGSEQGPVLRLRLDATVLNTQGSSSVNVEESQSVESDEDAERLGETVARLLIAQGAEKLLHGA
ncbi:hypothetical protein LTR78_008670 [Recurvomyces mirabilis]|uniref:hydroxymethylbilane synthase n=1 Tax=Recurvomyces mirabilis TaxID=574656 RepID=A0AAE0TUE8_9PEZI|nr:hypothetical protein LTR78_008670 [Recurvomyces mirabilis]KAK5159245.1 hypothetical protein LTS14_002387 [Recurvomyces mirabilis]